jgi:hypothetical protein
MWYLCTIGLYALSIHLVLSDVVPVHNNHTHTHTHNIYRRKSIGTERDRCKWGRVSVGVLYWPAQSALHQPHHTE